MQEEKALVKQYAQLSQIAVAISIEIYTEILSI